MSTADAHAGRKVRCPDCSTIVTVPDESEAKQPPAPPEPRKAPFPSAASIEFANPAPASPSAPSGQAAGGAFDFGPPGAAGGAAGFDWSSTEEAAPRGTRLPKGWLMVRKGISLVYWGTIVSIAGAVLLFILLLLTVSGVLGTKDLALLQWGPQVIFILAAIPILIGQLLWLAAPPELSAKWLALASGICTILCLGPIGFIVWLLALRSVAVFFNNRGLARQIVVFLIALAVAVFVLCPAFIIVSFVVGSSDAVRQVAGMLTLAVGVAFTFWYLILLNATRTTIDRARTGRLRTELP
jgi:hypothetical protein